MTQSLQPTQCDSLSHTLCASDAPEWGDEDCTMKRRRHTPERVIRKLAEGYKLLGQGQSIEEVCRHLEITESTWHRWRNQYGGMKANDAKKLKGSLIHFPGHLR